MPKIFLEQPTSTLPDESIFIAKLVTAFERRGFEMLSTSDRPKGYNDFNDPTLRDEADLILFIIGENTDYSSRPLLFNHDSEYASQKGILFLPLYLSGSEKKYVHEKSWFFDIRIENPGTEDEYATVSKIINLIQLFLKHNITATEIKTNIKENTPEFINEAVTRLQTRAKELREKAQNYFVGSYFVIILSAILAVSYFVSDSDELKIAKDILPLIFMFIRSLVLLTLVSAVVKYSFTLGRAYMHEALKLEDRIHAISFGEFYLKIYNHKIDPTDMKEIFRDWNINQTTTAFLQQKTDDFDPKVLEKIGDVVKSLKDIVKKD